jgi:hypothetical protein
LTITRGSDDEGIPCEHRRSGKEDIIDIRKLDEILRLLLRKGFPAAALKIFTST